jgi:hypothetical protein
MRDQIGAGRPSGVALGAPKTSSHQPPHQKIAPIE